MRLILLALLLIQLPVANVLAAPVDLYTGETVVESQQLSERKRALPLALMQVLQKLSGQREMPVSPSLDEALQNADRILRSFRYINVERVNPDGTRAQELRLVASFMPAEIDRIAQDIGLPRWQQERPAVQIWVVLDNGRSRELKPVEYAYAWEAMEDVAALRGLPVSWPELDEEEEQ